MERLFPRLVPDQHYHILFPHRRRRLCGDLSETLTIFCCEIFSPYECRELKGHPLMLVTQRVNTTLQQNVFDVRVINHLNKLANK